MRRESRPVSSGQQLRVRIRRDRKRLRTNRQALARLAEIARIMVKYGFSGPIRALRLGGSVPRFTLFTSRRRSAELPRGLSRWEALRRALEELGPTFVKFGQLLSTRSDILPLELIAQLAHLQDNVQPVDWSGMREVLSGELTGDISDAFATIDEQPVASASMAQVYRAVLVTGEEVAVKVQRPGIDVIISTDLDILDYLAELAQRRLPFIREFQPVEAAKEFRKHILRELDFRNERGNIERFRGNQSARDGIYVPKTYPAFSTDRLLVMEFIDGAKMSAMGSEEFRRKLPGFDPRVVARRGADLILRQILIDGFFHADPHPGNIMILPGNVVCYLDFGMMGELRASEIDHLGAAILGVATQDGWRVTDALLHLSKGNRTVEYDSLTDAVEKLVDDYGTSSLRDLDVGELLSEVVRLVRLHGMVIPANLLIVVKALLTTEGVGQKMYPEFSLEPAIQSIARKVTADRLRPERAAKAGAAMMLDYGQLLRDLPRDTSRIIRQLRDSRLPAGFGMHDSAPLRHAMDTVIYRIVLSIVLAAVMVSSALVFQANIPPLWNGMSLIGVVGLTVSGGLSLGFLVTLAYRVSRRNR